MKVNLNVPFMNYKGLAITKRWMVRMRFRNS